MPLQSKPRHRRRRPYILFISGPTASGKTDLSLKVSEKFSGAEIINADIGQFYKPFLIGTAKPDWRSQPVPHHLFDILDKPEDCNVVKYRKILMKTVDDVWSRNKLPIVVGGSLFYIRSLFWPPVGEPSDSGREVVSNPLSHDESIKLWEDLKKIDPDRAATIDPHDWYRIERALELWRRTGKKPSELKPKFDPGFHSRVVFLNPCREILFDRINRRTKLMIDEGWIREAKDIIGTEWEEFLKRKKLIGYPEIIEWVKRGEKAEERSELISLIQKKTRHYAKRQVTFWKKFRKILEDKGVSTCGDEDILVKQVKDDLELVTKGRK